MTTTVTAETSTTTTAATTMTTETRTGPLKVLFVNSSPHKQAGNTGDMIGWAADELMKEGIACEVACVGGVAVFGCVGCGGCKGKQECVKKGDPMNAVFGKMREADSVVLCSPVHFSGVNPEMKAVIDRCGMMSRLNGGEALNRKVGAAIAVARRAGSVSTIDQINHFFGISGMFTVGSSYWSLGISGRQPHGVLEDAEAQQTMRTLGQNIAFLLKKLHPERASPPSSSSSSAVIAGAGAVAPSLTVTILK